MPRIQDKVAIVTGGASGLGKAIAALFVREGAAVTITDINENAGRRTADTIGAEFLFQDVTKEADWQDIIGSTRTRWGHLDILVNNAGIGEVSGSANDPENTTLEAWNRIQAVNAGGIFLGCKHAIPAMQGNGGGAIINISSIAALVSTPFLTAYGASKAAVRQLTMSIAAYCAQQGYGIRCNSIHPGQIRTPMLEGLFSDVAESSGRELADVRAEFIGKIPLGELGQPDDVAYAALYLASDEARHVTGIQLLVDGGMSIKA